MRILFVLHQFYPEFSGGTERVTLNLARSAQRAGHFVQVLVSGGGAVPPGALSSGSVAGAWEYVYEGLPVLLLPRCMLPPAADIGLDVNLKTVDTLAKWMARSRFQVAHVLHTMRMGSALLALQRCKVPYLLTLTDFFTACFRINLIKVNGSSCKGPGGGQTCVQDCMVPPWDKSSLTARHREATSILAAAGERATPSRYVADKFRESFPDLDFRVIPHGTDVLPFVPWDRRRYSRSAAVFGYLGSIIKAKGLDILLRAFAGVPNPEIRLRVFGGFYGDTGYHAEVRKLAKADDRVQLMGELNGEQVAEALGSVDVLCLPSRVPETFSLALNEAAFAGVPALVSSLGAPADRVRESGAGRVVPVGEVSEWRSAISDVANDPRLLDSWRCRIPLPLRVEEEAFFYESLYRRLAAKETSAASGRG